MKTTADQPRDSFRPQRQPVPDPLEVLEEQRRLREELEKKQRKERYEEKILKAEAKVDTLRMNVRKQMRQIKFEPAPVYVPVAPVKKSHKLEEYEERIKKGTFFEDARTKAILEKARNSTRLIKYEQIIHGAYGYEFGQKCK